jgi:hypothetical protein
MRKGVARPEELAPPRRAGSLRVGSRAVFGDAMQPHLTAKYSPSTTSVERTSNALLAAGGPEHTS